MPTADIKLGAEDGGRFFVPRVGNFQKFLNVVRSDFGEQPLVDDEQTDRLVALDYLAIASFGAGDGDFSQ
jgi:hypothetical protein